MTGNIFENGNSLKREYDSTMGESFTNSGLLLRERYLVEKNLNKHVLDARVNRLSRIDDLMFPRIWCYRKNDHQFL